MKIFSRGVTRIGVAPTFVSTAALRLRKALSSTGFSDKTDVSAALAAPSSSKKASNFVFGATTLTASSDSVKTSAGVLTESERAADPVPNRLDKKLDSCLILEDGIIFLQQNFENLSKVVNVNAEALADLLKKKTILRENFVSNESTIANTNEKTLKEILIPADSVSDNGEVNLNVFITTSADSNNKTIRIKIGNQVLYDSSLALPSVLNPNNGKIMIELTLLKTSSNSGFLMGKSVIVDTSGDVTQPGIGTITNLDWSVDQALIITGQNSVSSAGQITLKGGKFNLPSPVTEYVKWQYATQNGNCVRRKIAFGSEVGGGSIIISNFESAPEGDPNCP